MKTNVIVTAVLAAGLLNSVPAGAQSGVMRAPAASQAVPRAIEMHMQQKRTLEQREASEAKAADPASVQAAGQQSGQAAPAKSASRKAKKPAKPAAAAADRPN